MHFAYSFFRSFLNSHQERRIVMKKLVIALFVTLFWVGQSWALSFSSALTHDSGLFATAAWSEDATFSWTVDNTTNAGFWTFDYTWMTSEKQLSHIIIEVSDNFTEDNIFGQTTSPYELGTFGTQGNSNPGIPGDIYGLKFNLDPAATVFNFTIVTDRAPMWGNMYAKDGVDRGTDVYAYNTGFSELRPDFDISDPQAGPVFGNFAWALVPDTFTNGDNGGGGGVILDPIPEPSTIVLLGAGLLGLGLWHRKRKA
jgi:hypothetical protein